VHQAKYMKDPMKKFNMVELKPVSTPMRSVALLGPDEDGEAMDQREYRSMISSLLYLTVTQPDIQFAVGLCARFQASPRSSHQMAVQRVFRYLKHTPEFEIWYSASSSMDLVGFSDADFVCLPSIWLGLRESWCFCLVYCIFCFSLIFSSYSPKSLCFTYYTGLYLLNYAYYCARMSSNEM
jgi:hypothetical protein